MKKYFTTQEIAEMCQVSKGSVIRWIKESKLKAAVTGGGHHRVFVDDLVPFLRALNMVIPPEVLEVSTKKRALIIEDEPGMISLLRMFFEKSFPDVEIFEAQTGFEAGLAVSKLQPNVVLLDLMLPMIDGFQVCENIRRHREWDHIKIIAMTGLNESSTRRRVLGLGADDFMAKPFGQDIFTDKVGKALGMNAVQGRAA